MSDERPTFLDAGATQVRLVRNDSVRDPLPRPLTPFVGREREVAAVLDLLRAPGIRLVTLVGPGGGGKTRLALAAAGMEAGRFRNGIAFAALDTTTDPGEAPARIAQASGVPDAPGQPLAQRMHEYFRHRHMLLVLDNLEHLAGIEADIASMLSGSRDLVVLCTSRSRLGIAGEQVYPVPPLDPADAMTLFIQRARAIDPGFRVDDDATALISQVCEHVEHLPLAIELAAARTEALSLQALLGRLGRQLDVLTDGPRDAPVRHRTMRATIAWSQDLLAPAEQVLLRRLAVFAGGFSLDAASRVALDGADALEGMSRLVAAGLVRRVAGPAGDARFRLPVPIREAAMEGLEALGETSALRTRHSHYYRDLAEGALPHYDGPEITEWSDRVNAERDNCRTAMSWALASGDGETAIRLAGALWRIWWPGQAIGDKAWSESVTEGLSWIERTLPLAGALPVEVIAEGLIGAAALHSKLGHRHQSRVHAENLLGQSEAQGYRYGEYWACFQIGRAAQETGDLDEARRWLTRALDVADSVRDADNHAAMALGCLADVAKAGGNDPEALRFAEEGLALARSCGNLHNISWLALVAGRLRFTQGDPGTAARILVEGADAFAANHDLAGVRTSVTELAKIALALGQLETASALLVAAHPLPVHEHDRAIHDAALADLADRLRSTPEDLVATGSEDVPLGDLLDLARALETVPAQIPESPPAGLTSRELEVLRLVAEGVSNRGIADRLSISERTAENHVFHILAKLGLESRTAAATWAVREGIA